VSMGHETTAQGEMTARHRAELVARACRFIEGSDEPIDLTTLAATMGMSPFQLHRVFTASLGISPKAYADARRSRRARTRLLEGSRVADAVYDAGFGSLGRFYATSGHRLGMTPSQFRTGAPGVEIRLAAGQCSLGAVVVAASARGICAIELGDDPEVLLRQVQDRFHAAELVGDDPQFTTLVGRVILLIEHPETVAPLPLDVRGTAFQERVWQALCRVPAGTAVTYAELARRIGAPASARAVAGACAANRLAVAVPCHRVVRSDGALGGYRWGIERKQILLDREREPSARRDDFAAGATSKT
jgi:AraC family transcriptional regulator, regulatory protein of adaptative response / methylated-DNA-[protein]-cysteine methyltransferase